MTCESLRGETNESLQCERERLVIQTGTYNSEDGQSDGRKEREGMFRMANNFLKPTMFVFSILVRLPEHTARNTVYIHVKNECSLLHTTILHISFSNIKHILL